MKESSQSRQAFTLVELLVVIVVVGIFGTLLLPALAQDNKSHGTSILCLNNHAQLAKAWQMYANDSDGYVANNYTIPGTLTAISKWTTTGVCDNWAPNVMSFAVSGGSETQSITNTALARAGLLVPYNQDINIYHCPSDRFLSSAQKAAGWKYRLRSVSMNSNWGRSDPSETKDGISTSWVYGAPFRQWHRLSEVRKPADRYVFVDEHADSINDGFFLVTWGSGAGEYPATSSSGQWGDIPGFYHNNGTPFGFADGHAQMKKWLSPSIQIKANTQFPNVRANIHDQQWYVQHVAEKR